MRLLLADISPRMVLKSFTHMNEEKKQETDASKKADQRIPAHDKPLQGRMDPLNISLESDETTKPLTSFDKYMAGGSLGKASADSVASPVPHSSPGSLSNASGGSPSGHSSVRGQKGSAFAGAQGEPQNTSGRTSVNGVPRLGMADNQHIREMGMGGANNGFDKGFEGGKGAGLRADNPLSNLDLGPQNAQQTFAGRNGPEQTEGEGFGGFKGFGGIGGIGGIGGVGGSSTNYSGSGSFGNPSGNSSGNPSGNFPGGMCPLWAELKKPWRKRNPIKFWLGMLILVLGILPTLVLSVADEVAGKERVAVVNIEGIILDGKEVIKWIEEVQADTRVKGVLVRVNSPGGAVTPSQEIYFALKRLSAKKPVVVSMGALAASGGYYVSLPAQRIFAVPSTVTGSIGVKMELTNVEDLMDKLGIASTSLASGDLKDAGSPFKPLKDNERQYFMGVIEDMYNDFLTTVVEHRKITVKQMEGFADGRALTGRQAKELGLVDQLGDKNEALAYLYKECGVVPSKKSLMEGPAKPQSILEKITEATVNTLLSRSVGGSGNHDTPVFMYK